MIGLRFLGVKQKEGEDISLPLLKQTRLIIYDVGAAWQPDCSQSVVLVYPVWSAFEPAVTVNTPVLWVEAAVVAFQLGAYGCGLLPAGPWQNKHPIVL